LIKNIILTFCFLAFIAIPSKAAFKKGDKSLSIAASANKDYVVVGAGFGYYIYDGLKLNLKGSHYFGDPAITTLTPGLEYVLFFVPVIKPYVGSFYTHWFISDDFSDMDSIGFRGGIYYTGGSLTLGGGVVYEKYLGTCHLSDCSGFYPEIFANISF